MPSCLNSASAAQQFKARPLNRKILDSAGDLGVPRVAKKVATVAQPFKLSSRPAKEPPKPSHELQKERPLFSSFNVKPRTVANVQRTTTTTTTTTPRGASSARASRPTPAATPARIESVKMEAEIVPVKAESPSDAPEAVDAIEITDAAPEKAEPASEEVAEPAEPEVLSLGRLLALQAECFADDIVIEPDRMGRWTEDQVRTFFIEGIAPGFEAACEAPDVQSAAAPSATEAASAPRSPEPELIRDENDVPTPKTVEFHLGEAA